MHDAGAFIDQLMALWRGPVPPGAAADAAFATCYADPLTVNGTPMSRAALIDRARSLHTSFSGLRPEVLDLVTTPERIVVGFLMHARHTGPFPAPSGPLPATGRAVVIRTIDILTVREGLVTDVLVQADDLGLLTQLGAFDPPSGQ